MTDPPAASLKDDQSPDDEAPEEEKTGEEKKQKKHRKVSARAHDSDIEDFRKCTYRDYSHVKPSDPATAGPRRNPPNKEATFPMKLHVIVSSPEFWEVSWLPHGRAWRINNPKSFEERVIPIFFRHGRYTSFARQVNGWGFRRITHGSDFNSYYHDLFLRGMPHLCERMKRLTSKDAGARKLAEEEKTPDLAAISREHPLPEDIPMLPPAAAAVVPPLPTSRGMDNYLSMLTENGGVDAYLSSLSDAEIAFLARRQMFRQADMFGVQPNAFLGGDLMGAMNPGLLGPPGMVGFPMGPNHPGLAMKGDPSASTSLGRPDGSGPANPNAASTPYNGTGPDDQGNQGTNAAGAPSGGLSQQQADSSSARGPPQQGNPSVDQYLNRASDNELAQLIAMHDAAAAARRRQFGGGAV